MFHQITDTLAEYFSEAASAADIAQWSAVVIAYSTLVVAAEQTRQHNRSLITELVGRLFQVFFHFFHGIFSFQKIFMYNCVTSR